jgi:regulator of RNase E activity RraA
VDLSGDENQELLSAFDGLRVADVRDGMDFMMMHRQGSLWPSVRPVWRTRALGIARTCRYLPYDGALPKMTPDEYAGWVGWYYGNVCTYPWMGAIQPGDFCVIDQSGVDAGLMGSANSLSGVVQGARGYVTNGGVRDTDELILEKVPFWSAMVSQSMVQARLKYDAMDIPVSVGGVSVYPGDVVAADGDGVVVVPRGIAADVARYARRELTQDKEARRGLYDALGMAHDETVRDE